MWLYYTGLKANESQRKQSDEQTAGNQEAKSARAVFRLGKHFAPFSRG